MSVDGSNDDYSRIFENNSQQKSVMERDIQTINSNYIENKSTLNNYENRTFRSVNRTSAELAESDINLENNRLILNRSIVNDETGSHRNNTRE